MAWESMTAYARRAGAEHVQQRCLFHFINRDLKQIAIYCPKDPELVFYHLH